MSKQEVLYETNKYFTYKGKKLHIRFIDEYFDIVPRPTPEEKHQLKEDIQIDGLLEDIKINIDGIVLDGHTRIEICEELGWTKSNEEKIKPIFEVKEFETKLKEKEYVLKTNLMRRQLNSFQKVKLVSKLYKDNSHTNREQTRYDILLELKKYGKPINCDSLSKKVGVSRTYATEVLRGLKEDFCSNYEIQEDHYNKKKVYYYYILPKGEEVLSKGRPEKVIFKTLGRSIGVGKETTAKAIFLLNHAPPYMLLKLEIGKIGVMRAYLELTKEITKEDRIKRVIPKKYIGSSSKVICPHCKQISVKREWKRYNGKD